VYSLAPEKTRRLVYGPFYLAISVSFYESVKINTFFLFCINKGAIMKKSGKNDKAPDFNLIDQNGKPVKLTDFRGKKLLIYFYPKANTSG